MAKKLSRYMKKRIELVAHGYWMGYSAALLDERNTDGKELTDEQLDEIQNATVEAADAAKAEMMAHGKAEL